MHFPFTSGAKNLYQQIHVKAYRHISNRDMSNQSGPDWTLSTQSRSVCHVIAMFYNSAMTYDIYDQLIQSIWYNHTVWPCSCPCPTNKYVPHSQLIDRISHLAWLILSIGPAVTWYPYKVIDKCLPFLPSRARKASVTK